MTVPWYGHYDQLFIAGEWVPASTGDIIDVVSPVTEDVIARVPAASPRCAGTTCAG